MRFGRDLHKHQVSEWASSYIHYAALKKLSKVAVKAAVLEQPQAADLLQEVNLAVKLDAEQVESFYVRQLAILEKRAAVLCNRYGRPAHFSSLTSFKIHEFSQHEAEEFSASCLELRLGLKKLQWYGRVNRDGFGNLLNKLRRLPERDFDELQLCRYEFAAQLRSLESLKDVETAVAHLSSTVSVPAKNSLFLQSFCARFYPAVGFAANICHLVAQDESALMVQLLKDLSQDPSSRIHLQALRLVLLQDLVMYGSRKSLHKLVPQLGTMHNNNSEAKDTCLHRFVIYMGQKMSHQRRNQVVDVKTSEGTPKTGTEDSLALFSNLLDLLHPNQRQILQQQDAFGRSPLHYAAQYGLGEVCRIVLQHIQDWKTPNGKTHATLLPDSEEYTPLHLAVINGHNETVQTLLEFLGLEDVTTQTGIGIQLFTTLAKLTSIALRSNFTEIVKLILATGKVDLNYQAENGETAIFIAARCGRADYVKILLQATCPRELDLNISETGYGWTPLTVACVHGHLSVVGLLLEAGADERLCDAFGWSARDHTAFRGFWPIGKLLAATPQGFSARIPKIQLRETNALSPCLVGETRIFVNLGTLNTRKPKPAVDMSLYLSKLPYNHYPETGFFVRIGASGAIGSTDLIPLPILNDTTNYPHLFTTTDLGSVQLIFSIFEGSIESQEEMRHIGGAVALLAELKSGLGLARESLIRNYTIPVLGRYSLEPIGAITFDFLVVKPFPDPNAHLVAPREIWDQAGQTQVIGHRGLGQNHPSFRRLQIGENTIQSFLSTMDLGVSYIECDVQLTRDHVPVIYHDFLLSESGADLAPHQLSFDQFMHINDIQTGHSVSEALPEKRDLSKLQVELRKSSRSRSRAYSLDPTADLRSRSLLERMKLTYEFRLKGFKGNIRGEHIHGPFTTLEDMLRVLPKPLGIDIELKYPMLWEAEDWKMDTYGVELNLFVDTILQKVYNFGGQRKIIFTSFSPELCILLAHKQNRYPVLFLNESNLFPTGDVRASNLQEAVYFARRWNLHGVVMSSEPFVMSPKLMAYVKDAGLVSVSFGFLNNDAENAKMQFNNLDAIITDDVNLIASTLRSADS